MQKSLVSKNKNYSLIFIFVCCFFCHNELQAAPNMKTEDEDNKNAQSVIPSKKATPSYLPEKPLTTRKGPSDEPRKTLQVRPNRSHKKVSRQDLLDFGFREIDRRELMKNVGEIPDIIVSKNRQYLYVENWYYIKNPSTENLLKLFGIEGGASVLIHPSSPGSMMSTGNRGMVDRGCLYAKINSKMQITEAWLQRWTLREPNEAKIIPEPIFSLAKWDLDQVKDKKSILSLNDKRTEFPKTQTKRWAEKTLAEKWQPPKDVETVCVQEGVLGLDLVYRKWTHEEYAIKLIQTSRLFVLRITFPDDKLKGSTKHQSEQVEKIFEEIFPAVKIINGQEIYAVSLRDWILMDVFANPPRKIVDKETQKALLWGNPIPPATDPNKHIWFECVSWWCDDTDLVIYFPKIQNSSKLKMLEAAQFPPVLYNFPSDKGWFQSEQ